LNYSWQGNIDSKIKILSKFKSETKGELYKKIYKKSDEILNQIVQYNNLIFDTSYSNDYKNKKLMNIFEDINKEIDNVNELLEQFKLDNQNKFISY